MSQSELLKTVAGTLSRAGMPYMLTGSLVSSLQGEPRSSHDIDVVVRLTAGAIPALQTALPAPRFYLDPADAEDAIRRASMFNVVDTRDGGKVNFWMLTDEPFDRARFSRRVEATFEGTVLWVSRPEDTILAKLRWSRLSGGSEKQFGDALRVFEVQRAVLDLDYLGQWADRLEVRDLHDRILREAVDPEG